MESDAPDKVVVSLSKSKLLLHFLGGVAFVVGGIWIWSIADTQKQFPPLFMKGVALANISFFGLCAIYGCSKLFDPRPGLIIDDQGIVDHSSAVAVGRILWCDCVTLNVTEIVGQRFITILVLEPQKYTARGNFFARMLKVINTKMTGSPISISSISLHIQFDELVQQLAEAFENRKQPAEPVAATEKSNAKAGCSTLIALFENQIVADSSDLGYDG